SGPSSNVSATLSLSSLSRPWNSAQVSSVSSCSLNAGILLPRSLGRRTLLARLQQALAQVGLLVRRRVEGGNLGQCVEPAEAEQLLEQGGRPVEHGAELRAARLLDQPALEQRRDGGLGGDAADARDLRPRHRLQVGDDRQALALRLRQRRRARTGQQAARGGL